jgi:hypothetical protein
MPPGLANLVGSQTGSGFARKDPGGIEDRPIIIGRAAGLIADRAASRFVGRFYRSGSSSGAIGYCFTFPSLANSSLSFAARCAV